MVPMLLILWNLLWAPVEVGGREDPPRGYQTEQPADESNHWCGYNLFWWLRR